MYPLSVTVGENFEVPAVPVFASYGVLPPLLRPRCLGLTRAGLAAELREEIRTNSEVEEKPIFLENTAAEVLLPSLEEILWKRS